MKLSLVVTTPGKTQGATIPINLSQFLIGRDPQCNLRPASGLISKRHCVIVIRDNKIFLRDFDSTNGTFVNDQPVKNEVELQADDILKVGPLAFRVQVESTAPPSINQQTPPPPTKKIEEPSDDDSAAALLLSLHDDGDSGSAKPAPTEVPEGSTVMEIMAVDAEGKPIDTTKASQEKKEGAKPATLGNTSNAAKAILEKYMRRPRGGA